jgi:dihydrodipicolinate reductase
MTKVLVLGAGGQFARHVVAMLDSDADVQLTLFVRNPRKPTQTPANARIVQASPRQPAKKSATDLLIEPVDGSGTSLFHDEGGRGYMTVVVGDSRRNYPLRSSDTRM